MPNSGDPLENNPLLQVYKYSYGGEIDTDIVVFCGCGYCFGFHCCLVFGVGPFRQAGMLKTEKPKLR